MQVKIKQGDLRQVETWLSRDGWQLLEGRGKGRHRMYRDEYGTTISIAPKSGNKMDVGMMAGLARQVRNAHHQRLALAGHNLAKPAILGRLIHEGTATLVGEDHMETETPAESFLAPPIEEPTVPLTKKCKGPCQEEKALDEFFTASWGEYGRHPWCKKCFGEQSVKKKLARKQEAEAMRQAAMDRNNLIEVPASDQKVLTQGSDISLQEWLDLAEPSLLLLNPGTLPSKSVILRWEKDTVSIYSTSGAGFTHAEGKGYVRGFIPEDIQHWFNLFTENEIRGVLFH